MPQKLLVAFLLLFHSLGFGQQLVPPDDDESDKWVPLVGTQEVVDFQRQLIILSEASETDWPAQEASQLGLQMLHHQREHLDFLDSIIRAKPDLINHLLDQLEDEVWWDVDKLAFRTLLDELAGFPAFSLAQRSRLQEDIEALDKIDSLYADELSGTFGRGDTRAMEVRRKQWGAYLKHIRSQFPGTLTKNAWDKTPIEIETTRGSSGSIWGYKLPAKTVCLTFDDGPHYKYTAQVLDILEKRNIPAVFFQVGENVDGSAGKFTARIAENQRYLLGNHSTSHKLLSKLDSAEVVKEVDACFSSLKTVSGKSTTLFRPPYGGTNDQLKTILKDRNSKPYMWNIDSKDWADPLPTSIAHRVVVETEKQGRGVILLHDIHKKTVEALPLIIDTLQERGYRFVLWDGKTIETPAAKNIEPMAMAANSVQLGALYPQQWALVIGINAYENWPKLSYAVNDAEGVKQVLQDKLNFAPENIITLTDAEATQANIMQTIGEQLGDPNRVGEDDAVFIFFAGHGMTRALPSGRTLGSIIPVDAAVGNYVPQALTMTMLQDLNEMIPARHVFWVMDACYSGLALNRSGNPPATRRYLQEVTTRRARQVLTAGGADEEVADGGPNGHSIFTWTLLNGLNGDADLNKDGFIAASEIYNYVPPLVSSMSKQTPAFGSLVGSAGGDFIFTLQPDEEVLSETSVQHDDETVALKQEIESLRRKLAEMESRLSGENPVASRGETQPEEPETDRQRIIRLNNEGLEFYRQKDYDSALVKFKAAVETDPTHPQSVNNLGFLYHRMGQPKKARTWLIKVLEIDPNRTPAYVNLADVLAELGETQAAIANYEIYLSRVKEGDYANRIRQKVEKLKGE